MLFRYGFLLLLFAFIYKVVNLIYQDLKKTTFKTEIASDEVFYFSKEQEYVSPAKLEKVNGDIEINLTIPVTTLGRGEHNHIVISDTYTSYEHARIVHKRGEFYLEDLQSTNGTFLNGVRIQEGIELKGGDQIKIGETIFIFRR